MGRAPKRKNPNKPSAKRQRTEVETSTKCKACIQWIERDDLTLQEEQQLSSSCPQSFMEWSSGEKQKHLRYFACKNELSQEFIEAVKSALKDPREEFEDTTSFLEFGETEKRGVYSRVDDTLADKKKYVGESMIDVLSAARERFFSTTRNKELDPKRDLSYLFKTGLGPDVKPVYVYEVEVPGMLETFTPYTPTTKIRLWNLTNPLHYHAFSRVDDKDPLMAYRTAGLNWPQIYFGSPLSITCWHQEEYGPYSILYHAEGKPKIWLFIAEEDTEKFVKFAQNHTTVDGAEKCGNVLYSKRFHIDHEVLLEEGIAIQGIVQEPGSYVVVPGRQFHCVINSGENLAITVNFTPEWFFKEGGNSGMKPVPSCKHPEHQNPVINTFNRMKLLEDFRNRPELACRCEKLNPNQVYAVKSSPPEVEKISSERTAELLGATQNSEIFNLEEMKISRIAEERNKLFRRLSSLLTEEYRSNKKIGKTLTKLKCLEQILNDLQNGTRLRSYHYREKRMGICSICKTLSWDLWKHMQTHNKSRPQHKCVIPGCRSKFSDEETRFRHLEETHLMEYGPYKRVYHKDDPTRIALVKKHHILT